MFCASEFACPFSPSWCVRLTPHAPPARCGNGNHDKSNMGRQSPHVHDAGEGSCGVSWIMASVLSSAIMSLKLTGIASRCRWPVVYIPHGGLVRPLPRNYAGAGRCWKWCNTVHGVRGVEEMGIREKEKAICQGRTGVHDP